MKSKKEIIEALRNCADETPHSCRKCPYYEGSAQCITNLMKDALELIEAAEHNFCPNCGAKMDERKKDG